jgi:hypothetical protein
VCVRRAALRAPDAAARRFLVSPLVAILILLLLAVVILVVAAPLRARDSGSGQRERPPGSPAPAPAPAGAGSPERAELETAREAKYREIRDADLDHRTGKLSDADHAQLDAGLRAEAIAILGALDAAESGVMSGAGHDAA